MTDTRESILRTASLLFWRHGYRGTSTRQIAASVGVTQPALFHFFSSKQAIAEELLAMSLDETLLKARAALADPGSPAVRLRTYVYGDLLAIHSGTIPLAGAHASDFIHEPGFEAWAAKLGELADILQSLVTQGVAAGEFVATDPVIAEAMIAGITVSHMNLNATGLETSPEDAARQGAEFILRGLSGPRSAPRGGAGTV